MTEQVARKEGCVGKGCLIAFLGSFALGAIFVAGLFYLYVRTLDHCTARQPADITVASPLAHYQIANVALNRFRSAVSANREEVIEFTADDLNALVARHPDFTKARGRVRFGIADSSMMLDLSVPINSVRIPRLSGRWFNGSARFTLNYEYDQFRIEPMAFRAGDWRMPGWILNSQFGSTFSQSFSRGFQQSIQKEPRTAAFWRHIRKISLDREKLVVTTQRAE